MFGVEWGVEGGHVGRYRCLEWGEEWGGERVGWYRCLEWGGGEGERVGWYRCLECCNDCGQRVNVFCHAVFACVDRSELTLYSWRGVKIQELTNSKQLSYPTLDFSNALQPQNYIQGKQLIKSQVAVWSVYDLKKNLKKRSSVNRKAEVRKAKFMAIGEHTKTCFRLNRRNLWYFWIFLHRRYPRRFCQREWYY